MTSLYPRENDGVNTEKMKMTGKKRKKGLFFCYIEETYIQLSF